MTQDAPFLLYVCPYSPACVPILLEMKVFVFAFCQPHFTIPSGLLNMLLEIIVQSTYSYARTIPCYCTLVVMPAESRTKKNVPPLSLLSPSSRLSPTYEWRYSLTRVIVMCSLQSPAKLVWCYRPVLHCVSVLWCYRRMLHCSFCPRCYRRVLNCSLHSLVLPSYAALQFLCPGVTVVC